MGIEEIQAASLLRKHKKIDSWFLSSAGMNLYRGCFHNCAYCDGKAEKYRVDDDFSGHIIVKTNAAELLDRELNPARKRKPMKKGFLCIGGGVTDSYQPVDAVYELSRKALQVIQEYNHPVHILTKSILVERDLDIIKQINSTTRAIVSMSFSSVDDKISALFEPGVPPPSRRLKTFQKFKANGIACGMYLMPVLPFITDKPVLLDNTVKAAKDAGVDFVMFGGLTLKPGRQTESYFDVIKAYSPQLLHDYQILYPENPFGNAAGSYYDSLNSLLFTITKHYNMPCRIPSRLFQDMIDETDLVIVLLEHLDFINKIEQKTSPYGYAAYSISKLDVPIRSLENRLTTIKGIGRTTEKVIKQILETGTYPFLEYYYK